MTVTVARSLAVAAALVSAVVHAVLVAEHLEEVPYIGWLFLAGTVLLVISVIALLVPSWRPAGWVLGSLVCAGMIVGYVLSRTVGLPQGYKEAWGDTSGTVSLAVEVIFLAAAVVAARDRRVPRSATA